MSVLHVALLILSFSVTGVPSLRGLVLQGWVFLSFFPSFYFQLLTVDYELIPSSGFSTHFHSRNKPITPPPTPSNLSTSLHSIRIRPSRSNDHAVHAKLLLTDSNNHATMLYDPAPPHAPALLLLSIHHPPLHYPSPRTRRKRRKPFPLMRLLHNSRTPRGWSGGESYTIIARNVITVKVQYCSSIIRT